MAVIGARPATGILGRRARPRPTRPAPRPRVRHVGALRRQRQASVAGLITTIVAAAALAFFYLSQSSNVTAVGYQIDSLRAQIQALQAQQERLVMQIGAASAPSTVLQRAADDLHLVPLSQSAVSFATSSGAPGASPSPDTVH
jgi:outer membrane murein-binding lipoprotein Lpp